MFTETRHFFQTACRFCWLLFLLGGIHGGVIPAQDSSDSRAAIPSADRQKSIRTSLDESQGLSKATTTSKKQQALRDLMKMAENPATSPDELYVVLQAAFPLIRETSDIAALRAAIPKLTETFQVERFTEHSKQLEEFIAACKLTSALDPAVKDFVSLMEQASRANRFRDARRWLDSTESAAKKLNAKLSLAMLEKTRTVLVEREQAFAAKERSLKTLETNPADPKANYLVGQWLGVFENDWKAALPHLAKGSDVKWQTAAKAELAANADLDSRLAMADAWWDVAQVATGVAKSVVQLRTYEWYTQLALQVTSPLVKATVTKRKDELAKSLNVKPAIVNPAPPANPAVKVVGKAADENELPVGKSIDLLEMVKLPDHTVLGNWTRRDGAIGCEAFPNARFMVPIVVTGSYQVTCRFTRRTGNQGVAVIFPVGETGCLLMVDYGSNLTGLELIDGRYVHQLLDTPAAIRQNGTLANLVAHELQVIVLQQGQNVTIQASTDGVRVNSWKGSVSQLSCPGGAALPNPHGIGVITHESIVDVQELKLELKKGGRGLDVGRGFRLGDDWKNPLFAVADRPTPDVAKRCLTWNKQNYFISDKPLSLPDAQLLATQLKGRLLTISSADEEKFILDQGRGLSIWMAGWRPPTLGWRDERNRPLRYQGKWCKFQPENRGSELLLGICTGGEWVGWHDVFFTDNFHACIEWGEEYPSDLKTEAK